MLTLLCYDGCPYAIRVPNAEQNFFGDLLLVTKQFWIFRFRRAPAGFRVCIDCAMLLRKNSG